MSWLTPPPAVNKPAPFNQTLPDGVSKKRLMIFLLFSSAITAVPAAGIGFILSYPLVSIFNWPPLVWIVATAFFATAGFFFGAFSGRLLIHQSARVAGENPVNEQPEIKL